MATINWIISADQTITAEVKDGVNLMEAAVANNVPHVLGECGGCLSCATCHVFVDAAWVAKTGKCDDIEESMLEITEVPMEERSRLSCQLVASPELDGLVLHVPNPD